MCIEVVIERGVLETEGVGGYFVCLAREPNGTFQRHLCALFSFFAISVGTPYTRVHEGGWRGRPSAELGDTGTAPHCRALWPRSRLPLASLLFLTRPAALARPRALAATATDILLQKRKRCRNLCVFLFCRRASVEHDILVPKLEELIIEHFGGTPRPAPSAGAGGLLAKVKSTSPPQRAV